MQEKKNSYQSYVLLRYCGPCSKWQMTGKRSLFSGSGKDVSIAVNLSDMQCKPSNFSHNKYEEFISSSNASEL